MLQAAAAWHTPTDVFYYCRTYCIRVGGESGKGWLLTEHRAAFPVAKVSSEVFVTVSSSSPGTGPGTGMQHGFWRRVLRLAGSRRRSLGCSKTHLQPGSLSLLEST
jgi:hypothetical protein